MDLDSNSRHELQAAIDRTNGAQSLKHFLFEKSQKGEALKEEEEEYVDLLNRQEVIERQLESTTKQRDLLKEEIQALTIDGELLQKLYAQRDELLDFMVVESPTVNDLHYSSRFLVSSPSIMVCGAIPFYFAFA
ncbi:uncharacterized protein CEXT_527791 [Caerostris extrusa]|uniref:Uncharacterized protein n=1 Tax=Caerostris extrusa TaxID=172846 RepID=A0AAV4XSV1_CAEEX|nr:uncharacterized protein CEXT_527791 [Caerostris extrusa]